MQQTITIGLAVEIQQLKLKTIPLPLSCETNIELFLCFALELSFAKLTKNMNLEAF